MPGLGRRIEKDQRDNNFPARTLLTADEQPIPPDAKRYWWDNGAWLDQGTTGQCVGYGTVCWVEDSPVTHPDQAYDPVEFYKQACLRDQWPENDVYDPNFGSSVHAAGRYLRDLGLISEYRWAFSLNDAIRWLLYRGPILVGTSWYWSMFDTSYHDDALGEPRMFCDVDVDSGLAGGHCYLWNGVNMARRTIRIKLGSCRRNGFGVEGRASLTFEHAEFLIHDYGELMMANELRGAAG